MTAVLGFDREKTTRRDYGFTHNSITENEISKGNGHRSKPKMILN
jgi:hypothetical protein